MSYREEKYKIWLESRNECDNNFKLFIKKGIIIKITDRTSWTKRYLEKAEHNLDFAALVTDFHKDVIKQTFYDWVTIAYYYAVYHAALALIANIGFKSKSHLATLCGIIIHYYHKNKNLDEKYIEILRQIEKRNIEQFVETQDLRERASYGVSTDFEKGLALIAKKDAIEFINKTREILQGQLSF